MRLIKKYKFVKVFDLRNVVESPPFELSDHPEQIADLEIKFLGTALSYSKTDAVESALVNSTCKEIAQGKTGSVNLAVHINSLREYKTKNGKNPGQVMAFMSVEDSTACLDSAIVFPDAYEENKQLLYEGNTVIVMGQVSKKKDTSLIINKVSQA